MPRALRQSFNREVERERAPQVQSRQAPDEVEQPLVDNMDEDESEGYGEEGDDDEEEEKGAFLMKPTLTTQTAVNRPLDQLNELLKGPYLDLAPQYQRDVVWPIARMSKLIDSLMENFYIPPVIFNTKRIVDRNGVERYKRTCVDGKQRLTSIKKFMGGNIPCHDRKGNSWYFCVETDAEGRPLERAPKRKVLPKSVKDHFAKKSLLCCEYMDLSETQEREIFQRVQLGIPLTKAEAFRATMGVWQNFAELYEHDFPKVVNLVNNKRASGFRNILICFSQIYECHDPTAMDGVPRLQHTIPSLERFSRNQDSLNTKTKSHLRDVFTLFNELVEEDATTFGDRGYTRVKTFAPIELVAVAVLLSQHRKRPKGMLQGDIATLRDHLRSRHEDLRMNGNCWASAWEYIDNVERYRGAVDASTIQKKGGKTKHRATRNSGAIVTGPTLDPRPSAVNPRKNVAASVVQARDERPRMRQASPTNPSLPIQTSGTGQNENTTLVQFEGPRSTLVSRPPVAREIRDLEEPPLKIENDIAEREAVRSHAQQGPFRAVSASSSSADSMTGNARAPTAVMTAIPVAGKRRADLDLGSSTSAAQSLAAKKARLMGTLKQ
ncbi:Domain of unknown function DUF262 [Lasallia pustulata]|uniref:GmrSD restriction endonucleases N-terminal domain-containing protein n=1 Tax=Lasallia pustulata TaxID=136370 RepID=A0A1W5DCB5_9LECA|nr:Domain of unknown function DUF262 [Lasallia pustulata]